MDLERTLGSQIQKLTVSHEGIGTFIAGEDTELNVACAMIVPSGRPLLFWYWDE